MKRIMLVLAVLIPLAGCSSARQNCDEAKSTYSEVQIDIERAVEIVAVSQVVKQELAAIDLRGVQAAGDCDEAASAGDNKGVSTAVGALDKASADGRALLQGEGIR